MYSANIGSVVSGGSENVVLYVLISQKPQGATACLEVGGRRSRGIIFRGRSD